MNGSLGSLSDDPVARRPRVLPGEAVGSRAPGLSGWARLVRKRLAARVRGEQDYTTLVARGLQVGRDVYIARGCYLDPGFLWLISIGDETTLGPNVTLLAHDGAPKLRTGFSAVGRVDVGARVFIGANATVLPGTTIGDDAIVGAGSVVRTDVPAGAVVLGNPAQVIGSTDEHTRRHLERLRVAPRYPAVEPHPRAGSAGVDRRAAYEELARGPGYVE
jgi:maltose O-acetyltransferase